MAIVGLAILYCLNLTLSNGGIKQFELQETVSYYTPAQCNSEDDFWIRPENVATNEERFSSRVDFGHSAMEPDISTNDEWFIEHHTFNTNVYLTINDKEMVPYQTIGLKEGDKIRMKYQTMLEPLNFVYGKCYQNNETEPHTLNPKEVTRDQGDLEVLEELVKVLNEEMEILKPKVEQLKKGQTNQVTSSTFGLMGLTVFIVLSVLAISIVLAFNIYKVQQQRKKIDCLSNVVVRYRDEIQVPVANGDDKRGF